MSWREYGFLICGMLIGGAICIGVGSLTFLILTRGLG